MVDFSTESISKHAFIIHSFVNSLLFCIHYCFAFITVLVCAGERSDEDPHGVSER